MIRFRHHDQLIQQGIDEQVPEIAPINSHDGTSVYKIMAASTIASISIQHKGDVVRGVGDASLKIIEARTPGDSTSFCLETDSASTVRTVDFPRRSAWTSLRTG